MVKEVDEFLMGESKVHQTLERFAQRLDALNIDFALAGGLAVGFHGHLRLTVDVDIVITAEDLGRFKEAWLGRGYIEKFPGSRGVKDTQSAVSIDFLIAGHYPGDGRPKPVRFPEPSSIPREDEPFRLLGLKTLIELKLASGLTAPDRLIDFADVIALVRANQLEKDLADSLDESVRPKYLELWGAAQTQSDY
ncbi:MAG: hypothetical protein BMS9Abin37_1627 [Acidobacteriota bacterium]|nr:MAG: hypothetical protein BMS9Abin37_1627 [Acidobacteriota bacterium]